MLRFGVFSSPSVKKGKKRFTSDEFGIDQKVASPFLFPHKMLWKKGNLVCTRLLSNATSGGYRKKTKVAFCSLTNKLKAAQITRSVSAQNLSVHSFLCEE